MLIAVTRPPRRLHVLLKHDTVCDPSRTMGECCIHVWQEASVREIFALCRAKRAEFGDDNGDDDEEEEEDEQQEEADEEFPENAEEEKTKENDPICEVPSAKSCTYGMLQKRDKLQQMRAEIHRLSHFLQRDCICTCTRSAVLIC